MGHLADPEHRPGVLVQNVGSGLFMEVSGGSGAQGAAIDTWYWNGGHNQYFLGTTAS
ncbi:RICIN domain-containing protein [Acrocarpospora macrocephala]|uniref:RICIN domain-containing protein n=1 Tax=Acrocarpospora macrocephala TaxID=150177 RepID=UPI0012D30026|nr:RICIN domain-containing protein [Acrocarpospora macrocephala]